MLTWVYQEGLVLQPRTEAVGGHWPMASACHRLNDPSDSRSPAELDLAPQPLTLLTGLCLACIAADSSRCPSASTPISHQHNEQKKKPTLTPIFCFMSFGISVFPSLRQGLYK